MTPHATNLAALPLGTILQGDVIERLRALPEGVVQCVVTSPPYWGLRQYLFDKAVVLRNNLEHETKTRIIAELEKRGIKPRV